MEALLTGGDIKVTSRNAATIANQLMNGEISPQHLDLHGFRMILFYTKVPVTFLNNYWKYFNDFEKTIVSSKQFLTEGFMSEHRDELDWRALCRHQVMSEVFMRTHEDYLDFEMVWQYQSLSNEFKTEYTEKANDWIMKHGKQVSSTIRLGKIVDDIPEEPTKETITTVDNNRKGKKKHKGTHKKSRKRDIYSYSDLY